ncbi:MAG: hypothetical protein ABSB60_12375 [Terracidiphilus sp.]|jgi:hypothetical protein
MQVMRNVILGLLCTVASAMAYAQCDSLTYNSTCLGTGALHEDTGGFDNASVGAIALEGELKWPRSL